MKIQFVSDVHCEFHIDQGVKWTSELSIEGDVLVLAGDITTYISTTKVCTILAERFPYVIYVCGNHEYYRSNRGDIHNKLMKLQSQHSNFFWLNNRIVELEGQRFVGSTLWWDAPPVAMLSIRAALNDFHTIQGYKKWVNKENPYR
jgi:predicted phosphodiesterase